MTGEHGPVGVEDREVLHMVQAERRDLCDWLVGIDDEHWDAASLCDGWTVRDVVSHLTLSTRETRGDFVRGMIRNAGSFDRMNRMRACDRARRFAPAVLVDQLRVSAVSEEVSFGSSFRDALIDVVVHGQDIARAIGRGRSSPPERVVVALEHALASRWYGARKRLSHATLHATDTGWTGGDGRKHISGPAIELLLVATGRPIGVDGLTGNGVPELRRSLRSSAS